MSEAPTSPTPKSAGSTWGKIKTWSSKTAKSASSSASKGLVKAKQATAKKMGVEPTEETPEMAQAIDRLKQTKIEVTEITKSMRGMYDTLQGHVRYCQAFSQAASSVRVDRGDQFAFFIRQVGQGFIYTDSAAQEQLSVMQEKVVDPLESFVAKDIEAVNKEKWNYTNFKNSYDYAVHNAKKAKEKSDTTPEKQADLDAKAAEKQKEIDAMRAAFIAQVNALELAKQRVLYVNMDAFWKRYIELGATMSRTMYELDIKEIDDELISSLHDQNPPVDAGGPPPDFEATGDYAGMPAADEYDGGGYEETGYEDPSAVGGGLPPAVPDEAYAVEDGGYAETAPAEDTNPFGSA